jgi:hypothetical protein
MIVIDEQLLGYRLDEQIPQWYRGTVTAITHLRPGTVIKDEAIPGLLRTAREPTIVTLNVSDFWRRTQPDRRFCIVCFALPDSRADEIPGLLRRLFAAESFRTRRQRLGKVLRVSADAIRFYTFQSRRIEHMKWSYTSRFWTNSPSFATYLANGLQTDTDLPTLHKPPGDNPPKELATFFQIKCAIRSKSFMRMNAQ